MNNIRYEYASNSTVSQILTGVGIGVSAGVLIALAVQHPSVGGSAAQDSRPILQRTYSLKDAVPTFDAYTSITGEYVPITVGLEQAVGDVYARLLAKQEPLGAVFEKVLYENLWDLYES